MKPYSIYFPQFYPTPTNDRAWGKGFTDWSLVAHANLHQRWGRRAPQRGFYDGANPAIHEAQMEEMAAAGLGGFGLYHYWFYSHQELDAIERTLLAGRVNSGLQWFLVWASEGWSRRWLGDPAPIASLSKEPSAPEVESHCRHLLRCFEQPSYFRWNGKPLFVWYHLNHFTRPRQLIDRYRETFERHGVPVAVGQFIKNPAEAQLSAATDLSYLFEPRLYFGMRRIGRGSKAKRIHELARNHLGEQVAQRLLMMADRLQQRGSTFAAEDYLRHLASDERARLVASMHGKVQEVVSPGWNNTPRYDDRYTALEELQPDLFGDLVQQAATKVADLPVLINAWNEWSEGAAIEPCAYKGRGYLDAVTAAVSSNGSGGLKATADRTKDGLHASPLPQAQATGHTT